MRRIIYGLNLANQLIAMLWGSCYRREALTLLSIQSLHIPLIPGKDSSHEV
jgi:hypothetical protein